MNFNYFYKEQSDQYAFYRIPKILVAEDCFRELSTDAKLLYGLLLDRVSLSASSGWIDKQGRVYIIYTIKSIGRDLHCGSKKAVRLLKELECYGLVEKIIRGQGKPTLIYVKNFFTLWSKGQFQGSQKENPRMVKTTILGWSEEQSNNTNINNTELSNIYPILSEKNEDEDWNGRDSYYRYFFDHLEMEYLKEQYPFDVEILESLLEMICDVVCSNRKTIRIAGDDKEIGVVKSQFMKLHLGHVEYVIDCLKNSSSKVRNMKQYMLATLYNAPLTMQSYYQAWVNHDMVTGKLYGGNNEENGN